MDNLDINNLSKVINDELEQFIDHIINNNQKNNNNAKDKAILSNVGAEKGKTMFDIYFSADDNSIVLKVHKNVAGENK